MLRHFTRDWSNGTGANHPHLSIWILIEAKVNPVAVNGQCCQLANHPSETWLRRRASGRESYRRQSPQQTELEGTWPNEPAVDSGNIDP